MAHYGQDWFVFDSINRQDFYFTAMAIFHFVLVCAILLNALRLMNLFSVSLLFGFAIYLLFEVYNQAFCRGESDYWIAASVTCLIIFIGGMIGFIFIADDAANTTN